MSGKTADHYSINQHITKQLENSSFLSFLRECTGSLGSSSLISVTLAVQNIDPLAALELLQQKDNFQYFWEKPADDFGIAAGSILRKITASGRNRFEKIRGQIGQLKKSAIEYSPIHHRHTGIHFLGGFSFFDEVPASPWESFGSGCFVIPEWQLTREGQLCLLTINLNASSFNSILDLKETIKNRFLNKLESLELNENLQFNSNGKVKQYPSVAFDKEAYMAWEVSVNRAKNLIFEEKFEKIVLGRKMEVELKNGPEPTHIINALREQYPGCYSFLISLNGRKSFIGCTPERLVSFRKNFLLTEALAGSIKRGTTATEDAVLEKDLLQSAKNTNEHNFVITAIEQRLGPLVRKFEKGAKPVIKKLTNVQHLFTPITGWLKEETDRLAILEKLHPTPAVGGYPWEKAKKYIKELENFERGWYAGPIGWLNTKDGGDFAVAIRSGLINNDRATFYAGCGIVEDSDPVTEWKETILKFTPMLSVLQYD